MSFAHEPLVLSMGAGKAAQALHGPIWREEGYGQILYDPIGEKLNPAGFNASTREAYEAGRLTVAHSLDEVEDYAPILDIVSSSAKHTIAFEQALGVYERLGTLPDVVLIEKPVVSSQHESRKMQGLLAEYGLINRTLVNENYAVSTGVEELQQLVAKEERRGNRLTGVDVVFYKDRTLDVRNGRFTDPDFGPHGIELPHQVTVAYTLAGVDSGEEVHIEQSEHFTQVHDIAESEGTYAVLRTQSGIKIRLSQGLGPYTMDAEGNLGQVKLAEGEEKMNDIVRYTTVHFSDGTSATCYFDPVPGLERFTAKVEMSGDKADALIVKDNTLERVIRGVSAWHKRGQPPQFAAKLSVVNAPQNVNTLLAIKDAAIVRSDRREF